MFCQVWSSVHGQWVVLCLCQSGSVLSVRISSGRCSCFGRCQAPSCQCGSAASGASGLADVCLATVDAVGLRFVSADQPRSVQLCCVLSVWRSVSGSGMCCVSLPHVELVVRGYLQREGGPLMNAPAFTSVTNLVEQVGCFMEIEIPVKNIILYTLI